MKKTMFPKTRRIHQFIIMFPALAAAAAAVVSDSPLLDANFSYEVFPIRSTDEAAVVEWGNSAIISALDGAVATFGPQTSLGAFFEVETAPVLANPINGDGQREFIEDGDSRVPYPGPLNNRDEVSGNMVIMTNESNLSGVVMARIAKESGAAALMVVNVDVDAPDYIYSLSHNTDEEETYAIEHIDIPVIMVSLASGNLITTATVEEGMDENDIVNNGMPDRVRLYAAGDRPFFEDVSHENPVLYLIHNLLNTEECDTLIKAAQGGMDRLDDLSDNLLEDIMASKDNKPRAIRVEGMVLWKGQAESHAGRQIEERIEQVTGYPRDHFSDWHIRKYVEGSMHELHYDRNPIHSAVATITVFLNEIETENGGAIVYPNPENGPPIKIIPKLGLAIVHHNTNQNGEYDSAAIYGELPTTGSVKYIAKRYVYDAPLSPSRRIILPVVATLYRGKLPRWVIKIHDALLSKYGLEKGSFYFDKFCIFCPVALTLLLVQVAIIIFKRKFSESSKQSNAEKVTDKSKYLKKKKKKKKPFKSD